MATLGAVRYMAAKKRSDAGTLLIQCYVKPGASKAREGILSVTDDAVELCVAAQARDGESNKAVLQVLSTALEVPRSDLQITRGSRSREKTIAVSGRWLRETGPDSAARARALLELAVDDAQ